MREGKGPVQRPVHNGGACRTRFNQGTANEEAHPGHRDSQPPGKRNMLLRELTRALVRPFGYTTVRTPSAFRVVRRRGRDLVYLHDYEGGYDEYRAAQVYHNKRKLNEVWADDGTLRSLAEHLLQHNAAPQKGICHGARNGFEVDALGRLTGAAMTGTDISETATQFPNMVVWDFHEENPDWHGRFDFVYTNSLDQAMWPDRALAAWAQQLAPGVAFTLSTRWRIPPQAHRRWILSEHIRCACLTCSSNGARASTGLQTYWNRARRATIARMCGYSCWSANRNKRDRNVQGLGILSTCPG